MLDRDVVHHAQRLSADAEHVVHVHRDTVDPDRVVPIHQLRDQELGPDAVRRDREADPPDVDHVREVSEIELDVPEARRTGRERLAKVVNEALESGFFLVGVDAGGGVGGAPGTALSRG